MLNTSPGLPAILALSVLAMTVPALAQPGGIARFAVSDYRIEGENPLPAAETRALLAPYTGESVTLDHLQAAAGALEIALRERGFGFMRVMVPPQDAKGTIVLRTLAFRLGDIEIAGNHGFDRTNILASLPSLRPGESPNLREIARNQAQVNDHPAKQIVVTMRQGKVPDTVDAEVKVEDGDPLQLFLTLSNAGTPATGRLRLGAGVSHTNLFNRDHQITATYTTSPGHVSDVRQYGFHYRAPFYSLGGSLSAYYTSSQTNSGTVAQFFEVSGRGEFAGLRWTQRFAPVGAYSHLAEAGVEQRSFRNDVSFNGTPIGTDVASRPLSLRYEGRYDGSDHAVRGSIEWVHNLRGGSDNRGVNYSANRAGADTDWQAWRFALEASRAFGRWIANVRLRGQHAREALIPGEQFAIGGEHFVRGLEERRGTGERGHVLNLELFTPTLDNGLRGLVFVDTGYARLLAAAGAAGSAQRATGVGAGLRWAYDRRFHFSADAARIVSGTAGLSGEKRLHATATYRF